MAKVPLRSYIEEIEIIIDQKQTEEAIAHCRHILQIYPKHIETYRMLGKAYLESQRHSNAADILQRILSAVPDDFISHVGMSIIREDENNLDAAIWHMERAFEGQPYNSAIQGELRRLYGKRDGMEPPKVHLTGGALARMYVKGNLHQQAIADLRSSLAEDPNRFDLRVYLALMYAQSGQDAKAIETCGSIINKLPYCLEANRILAHILEKTNRSEEAQVYKNRVQELEPYEAYIGPNALTLDQVPSQSVIIEQLVWDGGPAVATADQPEWAASVGVEIDDSRLLEESLPDWMDEATDEGAPTLPASIDEAVPTEEDQIPDWMKEAGWEPSTGEFDESQAAFAFDDEEIETQDDSDAIAGDIPAWLQDIAPPGVIEDPSEVAVPDAELTDLIDEKTSESQDSTEEEGGLPDWLAPAAGAAVAAGAAAALSSDEQSEEATEGEIPDWLQDAAPEEEIPTPEVEPEIETPMVEAEPVEVEADEMPDWLQDVSGDEAMDIPAEEGELPDWLAPAAGAAVTAGAAAALSSDDEPEEAAEAEIPDWLQEAAPLEETPSPEADAEDETLTFETEADEIPEWLTGVTEEVSTETPAEEEIPEWLQEVASEEDTLDIAHDIPEEITTVDTEPIDTATEEVSDWIPEVAEEDISEPIDGAEEGEMPDWLQDLAPEVETPISVDETEPDEAEADEMPERLTESADEVVTEITAEEETPIVETEAEEMPEWLTEVADEGTAEPIAEAEAVEEEIPEWMQEITPEEAAPVSDADVVPEEAEAGENPEWLSEAADQEVSEPIDEAEEGELPDWLAPAAGAAVAAGVAAELSSDEETEEAIEGELPDWLQDAAPEEGAPTPISEVEVDEEGVGLAEPTEVEAEEMPEWLFGSGR
jgi:tetratricopeptide (TPR) repeat protein